MPTYICVAPELTFSSAVTESFSNSSLGWSLIYLSLSCSSFIRLENQVQLLGYLILHTATGSLIQVDPAPISLDGQVWYWVKTPFCYGLGGSIKPYCYLPAKRQFLFKHSISSFQKWALETFVLIKYISLDCVFLKSI